MVLSLIDLPLYRFTDKNVRRRKLNNAEKADYIKAIKCLQSRPPLYQHIAAIKTRFDEFQGLHIDVADRVHTTVHFTALIKTNRV